MRGSDAASGALFSYVDMEARVPATHPLRTIRTIVNEVLTALDTEFEALYEGTGRLSVAPERLLRASLLQAFYSVRSERQLMEQINYNLLFRWFVGLGIDDAVWDHSTFSKNRERLLGADVAAKFLAAVLRHPKVTRFLSDEHFSVDGTLVEAWASLKSFRAKDGSDEPPAPGRNGERHFHNEKRSNETHASTTDPDARLYRKGSSQAAKLSYMGHALMENRHGLVVGATLTPATGTAEREAAIKMIVRRSPGARRLTLGADKGYDTKNFVADLRELTLLRMWRRTPPTAPPPAMAAPRGILAMLSARSFASGSRKASPGPRRSPDCTKPNTGVWVASRSSSSLQWQPTI